MHHHSWLQVYIDGEAKTPFWRSEHGMVEDKPAREGGVDTHLVAKTTRSAEGSLVLGQVSWLGCHGSNCCPWLSLAERSAHGLHHWRCIGAFGSVLILLAIHVPPIAVLMLLPSFMQDQDCFGGCFSPSNAYNGDLAVVRIWNKARSQDDIRRNMWCVPWTLACTSCCSCFSAKEVT